MTQAPTQPGAVLTKPPFLRAPEASRTILLVIFACACLPLAAGVFFFGWRVIILTAISVATCVGVESIYYRLTRQPALRRRTHAALMGLLLALTLPPFVPWYVPLAGGVIAIVIGKAIFGGVGHFLWQPALVGRLAVVVLFAPPLWSVVELTRPAWPVLAVNRVITGDIANVRPAERYVSWRDTQATGSNDAFELPTPRKILRELTTDQARPPESIGEQLAKLPSAWDIIVGAYGGGIGETCSLAILCAGLYLIYRNYVNGYLSGMMILAAAVTAAVAPVRTAAGDFRWLPLLIEGSDVGFLYVVYQVLAGELLLSAFFLAPEMTSRPVTAPAQGIFGLLCGGLGMLLALYTSIPIPFYAAVLACNTLTPVLDGIRPRVLGQRRWWQKKS